MFNGKKIYIFSGYRGEWEEAWAKLPSFGDMGFWEVDPPELGDFLAFVTKTMHFRHFSLLLLKTIILILAQYYVLVLNSIECHVLNKLIVLL